MGGYTSSYAFALPTLVITATILMITAVSVAQTAVSISTALRVQNYSRLADEAVQAGEAYAYSCIKKNNGNYWNNALNPQTNCSGTTGSGSSYIEQNGSYSSTFAVAPLNTSGAKPKATVTGTVTLAGSTKQYVSKGVVIVNLTSSTPVTTLPTSPVDGQEVYYQVYANGQLSGDTGLWHLRYNASTTYWDFLGGVTLENRSYTVRDTSSTTPVCYGTNQPNVVIYFPLNGDYDIDFGDQYTQNLATSLNQMNINLDYFGSYVDIAVSIAPSQWIGNTIMGHRRLNNVTGAGGQNRYVRLCYSSSQGLSSRFTNLFVRATPVRVK